MRAFFLIRSLERGGAERQLIELVRGLSASGVEVAVCTFYDGGALRPELQSIPGVLVQSLEKRRRWDVARVTVRLFEAVHRFRPDVVHGYMGFANELALVVGRTLRLGVVWGLRSSDMDQSLHDDFSRRQFAAGARLSRFTDAIIVNSQSGRRHHQKLGYCGERMVVIPNGIDCERFRPQRTAAANLRREWGVLHDEPLIGLIARVNPVKDHGTFVRAAAEVAKRHEGARFVCVGGGNSSDLEALKELADGLGLGARLIWAGARDDMPAVYNAIDVLALSSVAEGFPNVVAEAMASGKPCVVTDVGDARYIVDDCGVVVPSRNPQALARGLMEMLTLTPAQRESMALRARARIVGNFSLDALTRSTLPILEQAARRGNHANS